MPYSWDDRDRVNAEIRAGFETCAGRIRKNQWKHYTLEIKGRWKRVPGVTSIIDNLDKSRQLVKWASRVQEAADVETAWRAYAGGAIPSGLSREAFGHLFHQYSDEEKAADKIRRETAELGTKVHALIEHRVREMLGTPEAQNPYPMQCATDEALYVFSGWEEWAREVEFVPIATEFPVFSYRHLYAGSPDVLAWVRRALELVDWKTSNGIYKEMFLQNAAYRRALIDMGVLKENIPGRLVRLPKEPTDPLVTAGSIEDEPVTLEGDDIRYAVFLHLRGMFEWVKKEDAIGLKRWRARKNAARAQEAA
jgi:hypothetical protein